jgi:hypothetical protein
MLDSGPIRNTLSILSNKFEKWRISLALIIRIYHDERFSQCQIGCRHFAVCSVAVDK